MYFSANSKVHYASTDGQLCTQKLPKVALFSGQLQAAVH